MKPVSSFLEKLLRKISKNANPPTAEEWLQFYPVEFLLPKVHKDISIAEFPFVADNMENPAWSKEALSDAIERLGKWEYYFPFSHGLTTRQNSTFNDFTIDFHRYRSSLISETIIELLGDEKSESTVLDLACHCGAFSLDLAHRGVKHAHGIEFREKNLKQAEFLRDYYRVDNTSFEQGDVYKLQEGTMYDVVMCLGIMYHVVQPVELLEYCYKHANKFVVIDTVCHKQPIPAFVVVGDKNPNVAIEGTRAIEFQPTYRGIIETMRQVGFKKVVEIVGECSTSVELYSDRSRRCFIAYK
jgi:2-polyprenyl-3-methyl-5-hydroxy-6-metoxy-1,4-benzoquinol methylase